MKLTNELELILEVLEETELEGILSVIKPQDTFEMYFDPEKPYFFVSRNGNVIIEELTEEVAQSLVQLANYLANEVQGQSILEALRNKDFSLDLQNKTFVELIAIMLEDVKSEAYNIETIAINSKTLEVLKEPIPYEKLEKMYRNNPNTKLSEVVKVSVSELIQYDKDYALDVLSEKLIGDNTLNGIDYIVEGVIENENILLVRVSGFIEDMDYFN